MPRSAAARVRRRPVIECRSEDVCLAPGEIITWVLLSEAEVDALADGICLESLAARMWRMNSYKRDYARMQAREKRKIA